MKELAYEQYKAGRNLRDAGVRDSNRRSYPHVNAGVVLGDRIMHKSGIVQADLEKRTDPEIVKEAVRRKRART